MSSNIHQQTIHCQCGNKLLNVFIEPKEPRVVNLGNGIEISCERDRTGLVVQLNANLVCKFCGRVYDG